jgi:hypothetical protein
MKYSFREDEILTIKAKDKADPQKIGQALELISEKAGGKLTPPAVVEAARDKRSVLHKHFEWDDARAAESFRLDQARTLIRAIHLENTDASNGYARAFLSVREKTGTSYRSLGEVLKSTDLQMSVLEAAERDLLAFEARYKSLQDICNIVRGAREKVSARRRSKNESRVSA